MWVGVLKCGWGCLSVGGVLKCGWGCLSVGGGARVSSAQCHSSSRKHKLCCPNSASIYRVR